MYRHQCHHAIGIIGLVHSITVSNRVRVCAINYFEVPSIRKSTTAATSWYYDYKGNGLSRMDYEYQGTWYSSVGVASG